MSGSVARRIALLGTGILVLSIVVVGIGTGTALHLSQLRALDQTLLAAAHGHAHPELETDWEVEHSRSPVDTWIVRRDDPRVPVAAIEEVARTEAPTYVDVRGERVVLLPIEAESGGDDAHLVVAAAAPALTLRRTVGRFAVAYGAFSVLVATLASGALFSTVRRAFRPIDRARAEAESVLGFGQGARLTGGGPAELDTLLRAINGLLERLDAAWRAQGRFTSEAAHELRTPVTAMRGEIEVLLRQPRTAEEYRSALASVADEVDRLGRIVESLLALARLDAGEAERSRQLVHAGEVAGAALSTERAELERAGCLPSIHITDDAELEVNVAMLELALANLLRNAARHAAGTAVELRVDRRGEHVAFEVHDAGPGLPESERERVFDRFSRAGAARTLDVEGLGLGLSLAREVARRHGGDCVIEPSPLGGVLARLTVRPNVGRFQ